MKQFQELVASYTIDIYKHNKNSNSPLKQIVISLKPGTLTKYGLVFL